MKIDVTELMNRRSDVICFDYSFDPAHTDVECVILTDEITISEGGIRVEGECRDSLGCMMFSAHVTVSYTARCSRCLEEFASELEFDIERMILTERIDGDRHISDDNEWDGETDDVIYVNEAGIIPDAEILEELELELPLYELCSDDCPGLCQKCGKPLKYGDCGCGSAEKKEIDPRLAILQKLLDNKE